MDRRLQEMRRRALAGDEEAGERVNYMECQLGTHVFQPAQIVMSENTEQSRQDAACCQCGQEMFDYRALCEHGHHRWYYNPWQTDLAYWCCRPGLTWDQERELLRRMNTAYQDGSLELAEELQIELESYNANPITHRGCRAKLEGKEACSQGLHFLHITPSGRECRNPKCDYSEAEACEHPGHERPRLDAEDREYTRCTRCQQSFYDADICGVFGHQPDPMTGNPCIRSSCPEHHPGMDIYAALAETFRLTGRLRAVCRNHGLIEHGQVGIRTTAQAEGWNEQLKKQYGIRKPRRKDAEHLDIKVGRWGRMLYQVTVSVPWYRGSVMDSRSPLRYGVRYKDIREELKTRWAGCWYPVVETKSKEGIA